MLGLRRALGLRAAVAPRRPQRGGQLLRADHAEVERDARAPGDVELGVVLARVAAEAEERRREAQQLADEEAAREAEVGTGLRCIEERQRCLCQC